jgi:hypothetical protein
VGRYPNAEGLRDSLDLPVFRPPLPPRQNGTGGLGELRAELALELPGEGLAVEGRLGERPLEILWLARRAWTTVVIIVERVGAACCAADRRPQPNSTPCAKGSSSE